MVLELYIAKSAKTLPEFRKFDCGLDDDEHIKEVLVTSHID